MKETKILVYEQVYGADTAEEGWMVVERIKPDVIFGEREFSQKRTIHIYQHSPI